MEKLTVYTIGHSTHELPEFLALLKTYNIEQLVDVRTMPRSFHTPQFNEDTFSTFLKKHGIAYKHMKDLGGLRSAHKDSMNLGWRNKSFRGFADYMQTEEFAKGIDKLIELAKKKRTAIMCAEAVPWRCHRSLIGDALIVRKVHVVDIFSETKTQDEKVTSFAKVHGTTIIYPAYDDKKKAAKTKRV